MKKSTESGSTVLIISVPVHNTDWSLDAVFHCIRRQLSIQYGWNIGNYMSADRRKEGEETFYDFAFEIVDLM